MRTDVDDHMSWLRLGEAYSKAGRFAAALKALERARELDPDDWIASYFIGEVQRQMGLYEEAIKAFEQILERRPQELGVLNSIGQSYLDLGRLELSTGFIARAETSFTSAIRLALELVAASPGFRRVAWKTIADALLQLSSFAVFSDENVIQDVVSTVVPLATEHPEKGLADILTYPLVLDDSASLPSFTLQVALAAYDYRLSLGGLNDAASGAAHYDLGIALSTFARRSLDTNKRERAEQEGVAQFKHALRLEPSNDAFWLALGNATFVSQPTLCQHSYIRAIELDGKVSRPNILHCATITGSYWECRMRGRGQAWECSTFSTKMLSSPIKPSTRRRRSTRTMPWLGLDRVLSPLRTNITEMRVRCSNMPPASQQPCQRQT